jgi:23S rRNA pseudouridine2605 synthase
VIAPETPERTEKLQKVLARLGLGSRRELERWIQDGRVTVNGRRAKLGDRVSAGDLLRVDGRRVGLPPRRRPRPRVLAYHKPPGELSTRRDPEGRPTIFDRLPPLRTGRWVSVGRLDINTTGLILLTSDGELANRLMHPSSEVVREYAVRVFGEVDKEKLAELRGGVELEDGPARFESVADAGGEGSNHWYHVTLKEGRHREVRRIWEAVGAKVSRLVRIRYGPIGLSRRLPPGCWDELPPEEVAALRAGAGLEALARRPAERRRRHAKPGPARQRR